MTGRETSRFGRWSLIVAAGVAGMLVAGCGSGGEQANAGGRSGDSAETVAVVASTDVWGDVVKQVAGELAGKTVQITSIITDPDADPHSYEANTQNQLALSKADVVVENGGGYDDFVDTMLKAAKNPHARLLNAVDLSGHRAPTGGELNEHVWYDFPTVVRVADRVAGALSQADPSDAATFARNATMFAGRVENLEKTEARIKTAHAGEGVAITEPVPVYMLQACGLVNRTPAEFSKAIEEGSDVSAGVLKATLDLFSGHRVSLLAYNEQTSGPETERILAAAKAADIAVVPVTETLPAGKDYLSWMQDNLSAIESALG